MKHRLKISVSKNLNSNGVVSCRCVSVRERILRFLFGSSQKLTIVVPGDSVESLSIKEVTGGETCE